MNTRTQLWCAYCGFIAMFSLGLGWVVLAGFVPPPSPADTPAETAEFFDENRAGIRAGMIVCFYGMAIFLPWWAVLAVQVKRIEGRFSPIAYIQIAGSACYVIEFLFPLTFWANAAYRPEASPESIQRLTDLAWFPFLGLVSTTVVQCIAFGVAILQDKRERPIFPRWLAYFSFWAALLYTPAGLIICFKDGAFAWDGLIAFWMVFVVFSLWVLVTAVMLVKAIKQQALDPADPAEDPAVAARLDELAAEMAQLKAGTFVGR
jgi:hypothetical protein